MKKSKTKNKKGQKYAQLSHSERDRMEILLAEGYKQKRIADALNRSPSTITREIQRNSIRKRIKNKGSVIMGYKSNTAQTKFRNRERNAKRQWRKIDKDESLKEYIIFCLSKRHWSPDEISGRMREIEKTPFYASANCIYEWLNTSRGNPYERYLYSARNRLVGRKKYRKKEKKREMIPDRVGIEERPNINNESGHWEADTIVSCKKSESKECLAVSIERVGNFAEIKKIDNMKPETFERAIGEVEEKYIAKSFTRDNGIENKNHKKSKAPSYFCDPYSSWQKGKVENINKMIRAFIPKGSDISKYSHGEIQRIQDILNNKPRKSLGYKTPYEVMVENELIKEKKQPISRL